MKKLISGLHKFQTEVFPIQKDFFQKLAKGQEPEILFITCSDSRINPSLVTSADPGDLFIVRNAGNIIPAYEVRSGEAATIEFAINHLKVQHLIICGHSHCGAIEAAVHLDTLNNEPQLHAWIDENISPTLALLHKNYPTITDKVSLGDILLQEHVLQQIENVKTHPTVIHAIAQGTLTLHAWVYRFEEGNIYSFNQNNGQFELIKHL
ncbi:MAG: carbonic anhydrase [Candidatus Babeliales bacterium]